MHRRVVLALTGAVIDSQFKPADAHFTGSGC